MDLGQINEWILKFGTSYGAIALAIAAVVGLYFNYRVLRQLRKQNELSEESISLYRRQVLPYLKVLACVGTLNISKGVIITMGIRYNLLNISAFDLHLNSVKFYLDYDWDYSSDVDYARFQIGLIKSSQAIYEDMNCKPHIMKILISSLKQNSNIVGLWIPFKNQCLKRGESAYIELKLSDDYASRFVREKASVDIIERMESIETEWRKSTGIRV